MNETSERIQNLLGLCYFSASSSHIPRIPSAPKLTHTPTFILSLPSLLSHLSHLSLSLSSLPSHPSLTSHFSLARSLSLSLPLSQVEGVIRSRKLNGSTRKRACEAIVSCLEEEAGLDGERAGMGSGDGYFDLLGRGGGGDEGDDEVRVGYP